MNWLHEQPEPIVAQAMATEAGIQRRRAVDERHPLDCRCRGCRLDEYEPGDSLLPYFGGEDREEAGNPL